MGWAAFGIQLAIWGGLKLVQYLMRETPEVEGERKKRLSDFNLPRVEDGAALPLLYGKVRVRSPLLAWAGALSAGAAETVHVGPWRWGQGGDEVVLRYEYQLDALFILGLGYNGDLGGRVSFHRIWFGEALGQLQNTTPIFEQGVKVISDAATPNNVLARLTFLPGYATDEIPSNLPMKLDQAIIGKVPDYRGQVAVYLNQWYTTESPDAVSVEVTARVPLAALNATAGTTIGDGDVNPAHVIYDVLTNEWGRLGLDPADIDAATFETAATTLATEQHGFSMVVPARVDARTLIEDVLRQIDGVLYSDPETGKLALRLIRDDYNVAALDLFDESNVVALAEYASTSWHETYNEVRVVYEDRGKEYAERTAFAQDAANIAFQGGKVRSITYSYPGVKTPQLASALALRDLRVVSQPVIRVRLAVNRDAWMKRPGDVIKWSWSKLGISEMVLRVVRYDLGDLGANSIILECVQDKYAFDAPNFDLPTWETIPLPTPAITEERLVTEAPRFLQLRGYLAGVLNDPDVQHGLYLATQSDYAAQYQAQVSVDGGTRSSDTPFVGFPARARVATDYSRVAEPYDTSTGLVIENVAGITLAAATTAQIRQGKNLILVGGELMAFAAVTDLGGGQWRLNNVWRGLLDTVPVTHAVGERVYFLAPEEVSSLRRIGTRGLEYGQEVDVALWVRGNLQTVEPSDEDRDVFGVTLRAQRPYPVADLEINASKAPDDLEEEGIDPSWTERDRLSAVIRRGDEAAQTAEAGTSWNLFARKTVLGAETETTLVEGLSTPAAAADTHLGPAGYGTFELGIRSLRDHELPDETTVELASWQDPTITVEAPEWRNLLRNSRFADGTTRWTTTSGAVTTASNAAVALGGAGAYLIQNGIGNIVVRQDAPIAGYLPERMRAELSVYARNVSGDADDTLTLTLSALDDTDSVISSGTYGPTAQSTTQWNRRTAEIAALPDGTVGVRAQLSLTGVGDGGSTVPDTVVAECILRVGQFTNQLVSNPGFEGDLASWTSVSGMFTVETTTPYTGGKYARAGNPGSEYRQDVSIPAGFEVGAVAVLELARMNDAADDTGEVVLEVRDGSGVLDSATTGAEAISPTNEWKRRRLTVAIPVGATALRIRLKGVAAASGVCNTCFDDFDLRVHKVLDVNDAATREYRFDAPVRQYLPDTVAEWRRRYPSITPPNYGMWTDSLQGVIGTEPDMESVDGSEPVIEGARFVGCYDGASMVSAALEVSAATGTAGAQTTGNVTYGNFRRDEAWSVLLVLKSGFVGVGDPRELLGRLGTTGWELAWDSDEQGLIARVVGADDTVNLQGSTLLCDGAPHAVLVSYDPSTGDLVLVDESGTYTEDIEHVGEFRCDELVRFAMFQTTGANDPFGGQLRVYLWRGVALDATDFATFWTHGGDPTGEGLIAHRARTIAVTVGADATDGVLVARCAPETVAVGYHEDLAGDGGTGFGAVTGVVATNRIPTFETWDEFNWSAWNAGGTFSVNHGYAGPEGLHTATLVQSNATSRLQLDNVPCSASAAVPLVWFARSNSGTHTARVTLANSSGTAKETHDYVVTEQWQRFEHVFTSWDASTLNCSLWFHGSNDSTSRSIRVCGPFYLSDTSAAIPEGIPPAGLSASTRLEDTTALSGQYNVEGEIYVQGRARADEATGLIALLTNGTNSNDARALHADAGDPTLDHHDGSGTNVASAAASRSWDELWTIRGRWCRAGLLDAASAYAGVVDGNDQGDPSDYGRSSAWTPGTTPLDKIEIGWDENEDYLGFNGLIRVVRLTARETRLPPG